MKLHKENNTIKIRFHVDVPGQNYDDYYSKWGINSKKYIKKYFINETKYGLFFKKQGIIDNLNFTYSIYEKEQIDYFGKVRCHIEGTISFKRKRDKILTKLLRPLWIK